MKVFKRAIYEVLVFPHFIVILRYYKISSHFLILRTNYKNMSNLIVSTEIFVPLYNFLKNASLEKITISRIFTQQWKLFKIQTKEEDCECFINILRSVENEIVDVERKEHIQSLQDINKASNAV